MTGHWTTTPPTEPGFYWWRHGTHITVEHVIKHEHFDCLIFASDNSEIANSGGEWYSERIKPPTSAVELGTDSPHNEGANCPTWNDWCNCTVENLKHVHTKLKEAREAIAEIMRLQYGSDPANLDNVIGKYCHMRKERLELDQALAEPLPEEPCGEDEEQ